MDNPINNAEFLKTKRASIRPARTRVIENFILIWLNVQSNEFNENSLNQLRKLVHSIVTFTDPEQCLDYLSSIENEQIFLILSNSFDHELLARLQPLSPIHSIYLLSEEKFPFQQYPKVKGLHKKLELICTELQQELPHAEHDLTPISILKSSTITNLTELDQTFIYSQVMKDILLDTDYHDQAKKELIDFSRIQYTGNRLELQKISEFEREYKRPSPIWWYTRDCFVSTMLKKALRIQDTEILIKMGFFIRDLHEQIEEVYSDMEKPVSLTVYHGQRMFNQQLEILVQSQGEFLSFRNFLVASADRQASFNHVKQLSSRPDFISVLFKITINPSVASSAFASLDRISYSSNTKNQILFSLHTVFRIGKAKQIEDHLWEIDLNLANDNDEQLARLTDSIRKHARAEIGIHRLAKLMLMMGQMDKAKEIYTALLATTSETDQKELAHLHHQLAFIFDEKEDLTNALSHYHQSLDIYLDYLPLNDPQLCPTYSKIGLILKKQSNYDGALEYLQHALDIGLIAPNPDQFEIALRYNNIGGVLDAQGKRTEALENYEHALEIEEKCLPSCHRLIGATHNNIGLVYQSLKDYSSALIHFTKTLEIEQKTLPSDHPSLIMTYANLAGVFEGLHQYQVAIEHAEKAVQIVQNVLGLAHPHSRMLEDYLKQLREKQKN